MNLITPLHLDCMAPIKMWEGGGEGGEGGRGKTEVGVEMRWQVTNKILWGIINTVEKHYKICFPL